MSSECPICRGDNACGNKSGVQETCWCMEKFFPQEVFRHIAEEKLPLHCICETCLDRFLKTEQASEGSDDR